MGYGDIQVNRKKKKNAQKRGKPKGEPGKVTSEEPFVVREATLSGY